ncbi:MAG TPA: YeeE/YedE thiosulfate transporter family protein [Candidatus Acidoferrales bacterium]|nr:YeeE/YedE thiosulfate transporter family protein [Candidatus Acidoferrales bacterium]
MGPFVPDLISDQLNLVVALMLGIAFGFVLEQAGFSSSRKLAGVFYGYDFAVLRVFFTAAVTAASGVILLGYFGLLDTDVIYVNPTWLLPALVGGAIMGVGFILGGYCPGTSVTAAAIGKVDGMFFIGGGLLGVFAFGELFPLYDKFFDSTFLGPTKIFDSLGVSQGLFTFILIAVAVGAFAITTIIEKRVNKTAAPSLQFKPMKHFAAGFVILALGILFVFLPDRKTSLIEKVTSQNYIATHPTATMEVDELAFRIVDQEPNIRIIDIRQPAEYAKLALPGSSNIQMNDFFSKDAVSSFSQRHMKKVIVGDSEAEERTACLLLHELGYENLSVLKGGFDEFNKTILNPSMFVPTGTRWDADVKEFRENARIEILKMIDADKDKAPREIKKKKIQGGC